MKKKTRILSLILAVVLTVGILPAGVSAAYFPQAGAIDGAGGVANAVEAFLRGDLHHPDAGEVTGKVGDVLANIDVEHMEQVVAQQLINYDYNTAVKLLGASPALGISATWFKAAKSSSMSTKTSTLSITSLR